jgi:carbonic anhydrase
MVTEVSPIYYFLGTKRLGSLLMTASVESPTAVATKSHVFTIGSPVINYSLMPEISDVDSARESRNFVWCFIDTIASSRRLSHAQSVDTQAGIGWDGKGKNPERGDGMSAHVLHDPISTRKVFQRLIDGNERFLSGNARFPTIKKEVLASLALEQHPYATILGCSDSRVPPELIFDANFGELFVIRVAGNVLSPEVAGSMQYAGIHLKTPVFVVLGHENCGAVQAALDRKLRNVMQPSRIELLIQNILPSLENIDGHADPKAQIASAVEANVRWNMRQIAESPEGRARAAEGAYMLAGAIFEITTGRVRFLEPI